MLLMDIITWEPEDSLKVAEFYSKYEYPNGIKVIDEWTDLTGYRTFVIYETDNEKTYAASVFPFMSLVSSPTVVSILRPKSREGSPAIVLPTIALFK